MVHDHIIPESTLNLFPEPSTMQVCTNNVEGIIDDQVMVTRGGNIQQYLVKWEGGDVSNNTWLTRDELQKLAPGLLKLHEGHPTEPHSTGSNSFQPGRIDEDIKPPCTRSGRNKPNQYHIWAQTHIFHWIIQGIKEQAHQYIKLTWPTIQANEQRVGPTCDISRRPIMKLMPHQQKAHHEVKVKVAKEWAPPNQGSCKALMGFEGVLRH